MNAVLTHRNLKLGFESEIWDDFGASTMLSRECSYTFGFVVKAVGRIRVWKSCGIGKCYVKSPRMGWIFLWISRRMGLRSYWGTDWLVTRLSCKGPSGMGFKISLKRLFWNREWERSKYMCGILTISLMCRKICGLGFGLFLRGKCGWSNGWINKVPI